LNDAMAANFVEISTVGAITTVVRSASGACFPLQHFCPESGAWGIAGADSWQPECDDGVVSLAVVGKPEPMAQALCSNSAVIAATKANITLTRNIFSRLTYF
jgi:hypothetical protein